MVTASETIRNLDELRRLAVDLAEFGIDLLELEYLSSSFGSFRVVLGRGHDRLRFSWDGRESILTQAFARIEDSRTIAVWTHDADFRLADVREAFPEIASQSTEFLRDQE